MHRDRIGAERVERDDVVIFLRRVFELEATVAEKHVGASTAFLGVEQKRERRIFHFLRARIALPRWHVTGRHAQILDEWIDLVKIHSLKWFRIARKDAAAEA